jgi:hypothetical protein
MELGFTFNYGNRTTAQQGVDQVPNIENEKTSSRIYAFDVALGFWQDLSVRASLPLLEVDFTEGDESGNEIGIGDLSLWLKYGKALGGVRKPLKLGIALGAFVPTGGSIQSGIPSNPNFVSGTVDPALSMDINYDIGSYFGIFARFFTRLPFFKNNDGYQAGSSIIYILGFNLRLMKSLMPSIALTGLNRFHDHQAGDKVYDSGGDWIFLTPGLSYIFDWKPLAGLSLHTEAQIPVYQFLHGTQLADKFTISFSVAYSFSVH